MIAKTACWKKADRQTAGRKTADRMTAGGEEGKPDDSKPVDIRSEPADQQRQTTKMDLAVNLSV